LISYCEMKSHHLENFWSCARLRADPTFTPGDNDHVSSA